MGFELLEMVTTYLQEELPQYTEIYPYQLVDCYAALGDFDQALESLSKTDEHRLWAGWYFLERSPMFEPIWNEPRYLEFLTNLHAELARQRENLAHLEAQETEL